MSAALAMSTWWVEMRSFGDEVEVVVEDVSSAIRVSTADLFFE